VRGGRTREGLSAIPLMLRKELHFRSGEIVNTVPDLCPHHPMGTHEQTTKLRVIWRVYATPVQVTLTSISAIDSNVLQSGASHCATFLPIHWKCFKRSSDSAGRKNLLE
jgi:hypothetical protein